MGGVRNLPVPLHLISASTVRGPDFHTCSRPWEGRGPPYYGSDIEAVTVLAE